MFKALVYIVAVGMVTANSSPVTSTACTSGDTAFAKEDDIQMLQASSRQVSKADGWWPWEMIALQSTYDKAAAKLVKLDKEVINKLSDIENNKASEEVLKQEIEDLEEGLNTAKVDFETTMTELRDTLADYRTQHKLKKDEKDKEIEQAKENIKTKKAESKHAEQFDKAADRGIAQKKAEIEQAKATVEALRESADELRDVFKEPEQPAMLQVAGLQESSLHAGIITWSSNVDDLDTEYKNEQKNWNAALEALKALKDSITTKQDRKEDLEGELQQKIEQVRLDLESHRQENEKHIQALQADVHHTVQELAEHHKSLGKHSEKVDEQTEALEEKSEKYNALTLEARAAQTHLASIKKALKAKLEKFISDIDK